MALYSACDLRGCPQGGGEIGQRPQGDDLEPLLRPQKTLHEKAARLCGAIHIAAEPACALVYRDISAAGHLEQTPGVIVGPADRGVSVGYGNAPDIELRAAQGAQQRQVVVDIQPGPYHQGRIGIDDDRQGGSW